MVDLRIRYSLEKFGGAFQQFNYPGGYTEVSKYDRLTDLPLEYY